MLLLAHAGSTCALAGLIWVVQLVVYPGFLLVGDGAAWPAVHAAHSRRIAQVVTLPWAVQGVTLALLLVRHREPLWLLVAASVCAVTTVVVTVLVSVPLHERLATYDERAARALVRTNWWRTAAWTAAAGCALAMLALS